MLGISLFRGQKRRWLKAEGRDDEMGGVRGWREMGWRGGGGGVVDSGRGDEVRVDERNRGG